MSSTVRKCQRHSVTHAIVGLATDELRQLRHFDACRDSALAQLAVDYQVTLETTDEALETLAVSPGHHSETCGVREEMGAFLRFVGSGTGTLYVFDGLLQYPVGTVMDSSWAYVPLGKRYFLSVDEAATGTLMFEVAGAIAIA